jgi:hypothetical protein
MRGFVATPAPFDSEIVRLELDERPSIGRSTSSGVERSERNVSIDNIARIARGLKVKAHMLLDDASKV